MATTTQEPTIHRRDRRISHDWTVKVEIVDGESREHVACLAVSYDTGGVNYYNGTVGNPRRYRATLTRETILDRGTGLTARSFMLFQGVTVCRSEPVKRFSVKQFEAFAVHALAELERRREEPDIAAFFDPATY